MITMVLRITIPFVVPVAVQVHIVGIVAMAGFATLHLLPPRLVHVHQQQEVRFIQSPIRATPQGLIHGNARTLDTSMAAKGLQKVHADLCANELAAVLTEKKRVAHGLCPSAT